MNSTDLQVCPQAPWTIDGWFATESLEDLRNVLTVSIQLRLHTIENRSHIVQRDARPMIGDIFLGRTLQKRSATIKSRTDVRHDRIQNVAQPVYQEVHGGMAFLTII